jgi:hypothetical protein
MTPVEAITLIQDHAGAHRIVITSHAAQRMQPLHDNGRGGMAGIQYEDVRHALMNSRNCRPAGAEHPERWKVDGPDLEGDDLTLVVVVDERVIVITVM